MEKVEKHFKYYKQIIYKGDTLELSTKKMHASDKALYALLKNKPLSRKDIAEQTGWTKGQLAGLLYRTMKQGKIQLKRKKFYLIS